MSATSMYGKGYQAPGVEDGSGSQVRRSLHGLGRGDGELHVARQRLVRRDAAAVLGGREERIPADRDDVHERRSGVQRHDGEVDEVGGPEDGPLLLDGWPEAFLDPLVDALRRARHVGRVQRPPLEHALGRVEEARREWRKEHQVRGGPR